MTNQRFLALDELKALETPAGTRTHKTVPHYEVAAMTADLMTELGLQIKREQFAVTQNGMKMFGTFDVRSELANVDLSLGVRNSHNKTMSLGMVGGYRVIVCSNMMFSGDFTPVFKKHTSGLRLRSALILGIERTVNLIAPIKRDIDFQRDTLVSTLEAKEIILDSFVQTGTPKNLLEPIYNYYFQPEKAYETPEERVEFAPRSLWSLSNAFTAAYRALPPLSQFAHTTRLAEYLKKVFPSI